VIFGTADIDQLSRIINLLGNLDYRAWSDCSKLSDYGIISFSKVENPAGVEACLPNRSPDELYLVKKLVSYDPPLIFWKENVCAKKYELRWIKIKV
jgi:cell cycle related kinase